MFHTYVTAEHGNKVDFDRATWMMDRTLLEEAMVLLNEYAKSKPGLTKESAAMFAWGAYCAGHYLKYGEPFVCDFDPYWDGGSPPPFVGRIDPDWKPEGRPEPS